MIFQDDVSLIHKSLEHPEHSKSIRVSPPVSIDVDIDCITPKVSKPAAVEVCIFQT